MEQRVGDAPRIAHGGLTAREAKRPHAAEAVGEAFLQEEKFSAPDGAVLAVARAVEGDTEHAVGRLVVLKQTGEHVGEVVLHGDTARDRRRGPETRRGIVGMFVAGDGGKRRAVHFGEHVDRATKCPECRRLPRGRRYADSARYGRPRRHPRRSSSSARPRITSCPQSRPATEFGAGA